MSVVEIKDRVTLSLQSLVLGAIACNVLAVDSWAQELTPPARPRIPVGDTQTERTTRNQMLASMATNPQVDGMLLILSEDSREAKDGRRRVLDQAKAIDNILGTSKSSEDLIGLCLNEYKPEEPLGIGRLRFLRSICREDASLRTLVQREYRNEDSLLFRKVAAALKGAASSTDGAILAGNVVAFLFEQGLSPVLDEASKASLLKFLDRLSKGEVTSENYDPRMIADAKVALERFFHSPKPNAPAPKES